LASIVSASTRWALAGNPYRFICDALLLQQVTRDAGSVVGSWSQSCAFLKVRGHGPINWHSVLNMAVLWVCAVWTQSCAFLKVPGHGPTNWHSDLNMVPLDTNHFVTLWIPFRDIRSGTLCRCHGLCSCLLIGLEIM
jgi:hypothetical protein